MDRQKGSSKVEMEEQDRLSDLPDSVLVYIISFLDMADAVKTSVLSKRWDHLWTEVRWLIYGEPEYVATHRTDEQQEKFIDFVNRTLSLHEPNTIQEFSLSWFLSKYFPVDEGNEILYIKHNQAVMRFINNVNGWIRFAVRRKVQGLTLDFCGSSSFNIDEGNGALFELPFHIFCNDTLNYLALSYCIIINPTKPIQWNSLKSLALQRIVLNDQLLQNILCGAPLLEKLSMKRCIGVTKLNITSPLLKYLTLMPFSDSRLTLYAPYVRDFTFLGKTGDLHVKDKLSLVDFHLTPFDRWDRKPLRHLLKRIQHVKSLTIRTLCFRVFPKINVMHHVRKSWNLVHLRLESYLEKCDLPGIAIMLKTSHQLQTLIIWKLFNYFCTNDDLNKTESCNNWKSIPCDCLKNTLKVVKVLNFTGAEPETALLKFLLEKATKLQKMIINYRHEQECTSASSIDVAKISQYLLSVQRASPDSEVIFS